MASIQLQPLIRFDQRARTDLEEVGPIDFYLAEQAAGRASLFAVLRDGKRYGSVLTRGDINPNGERVFVIVAAKAKSEKSVLEPGLLQLEAMARANGYKRIRLHTDRIGLIGSLLKRTPDAETIVRWEL